MEYIGFEQSYPSGSRDNRGFTMFIFILQKPAKVLQETLIKLFDEWTQMPSAASHVQEEISLEMPSIDFDFKRKRKEACHFLADLVMLAPSHRNAGSPRIHEKFLNTASNTNEICK